MFLFDTKDPLTYPMGNVKLSYFHDYFDNITYPDYFGSHEEWNKEANSWLKLLHVLDISAYQKSKKRVKNPDERDGFLAEIKALYFIHSRGLKILAIEPPGANKHKLDFNFIDNHDKNWSTEVKRPSWRLEIMHDVTLTKKQKLERLKKWRFINGEGRSYSDRDALIDPIRKAIPKFIKGENNLLIIVPEMFAITGLFPYFKVIAQEEVAKQDTTHVISAILILQPILIDGAPVNYKFILIEISNKPGI